MTALAIQQQPDEASIIKTTLAAAVSDAKTKRATFSRLRRFSNSLNKTRKSSDKSISNRSVSFDLDSNEVHELPPLDEKTRSTLFLSYHDKVSIADDVEETCYQLNDSDWVHPYMAHLDEIWDKCATTDGKPLDATEQDLDHLVTGKGRGLEKKLLVDMKRTRDSIVRAVLETQKAFKNLPVGSDQRAKLLRNKYKKMTNQHKVFAQVLAEADAQLAASFHSLNSVAPKTA